MPSMLEIMQEERPEGGFVFNKSYTDGVNRKFRETMVDDYYATYDGKVAKINFDDKRYMSNWSNAVGHGVYY